MEDRNDSGRLLVRARYEGDIERHFGGEAEVIELEDSDYRFRSFLPREEVQTVIDRELSSLDYGNFKNSFDRDNVSLPQTVREERHDALFRVWSAMVESQDAVRRLQGDVKGQVEDRPGSVGSAPQHTHSEEGKTENQHRYRRKKFWKGVPDLEMKRDCYEHEEGENRCGRDNERGPEEAGDKACGTQDFRSAGNDHC